MRFRLGMVTGFAAGYYMGSKAGRPRYDQINRSLSKLRRSDTFATVADRAKAAVDDGVEKARSLVDARAGNGQNGLADVDLATGGPGPSVRPGESGLIIPGQPDPPQ